MNPYPLDRPVSWSMMSWIDWMAPNGSKMPLSMSSVMLKCSDPTYSLMGPLSLGWFLGGSGM